MQGLEQATAPSVQTETARVIRLAPKLEIPIDDIIGLGIAGFGIPGAGKTNAAALIAEQVGQYYVPMVIFDIEGDYVSLTEVLPRAIVATPSNCPAGADVLEHGLQVIYDLSAWSNQDAAAALMVRIVTELMDYERLLAPDERVPCMVFLDEASHWLPQRKGERLAEESYKALRDTFNLLAMRGRKYGLTPALFAHRISELSKNVLMPGVLVLMRQTVDIDINRYLNYISGGDLTQAQLRDRIARLRRGRAFVLSSGIQKLVTFNKRQSTHKSNTPRSIVAMERYAALPFDPGQQYGASLEAEQEAPAEPPLTDEEKKRQLQVLKMENPLITGAELSAILDTPRVILYKWLRELNL